MSNTRAGKEVIKVEELATWLKDNANDLKSYIDTGDLGANSGTVVNVGPGYGAPIGSIMLSALPTPPDQYTVMDGLTRDIAGEFNDLYAAIGHTYTPKDPDCLSVLRMDDTNGFYDLAGNGNWMHAISPKNLTSPFYNINTMPIAGYDLSAENKGLSTEFAKFGTKAFKSVLATNSAGYSNATYARGSLPFRFPQREFTMHGWYYHTGIIGSIEGIIFNFCAEGHYTFGAGETSVRLSAKAGNKVRFFFKNAVGGVIQDFTSTTAVLTEGQWNHIAFCYDGSVYRLYINGVAVLGNASEQLLFTATDRFDESLKLYVDPEHDSKTSTYPGTTLSFGGAVFSYNDALSTQYGNTAYFQDWQIWKRDIFRVTTEYPLTNLADTTLYGSGQSESFDGDYYVLDKTNVLNGVNGKVTARLTHLPTINNFSMKVRVRIPEPGTALTGGLHSGIVFRTTYWAAPEGTYAYEVDVTYNSISIRKGTNSSVQSSTVITNVAHGNLPGDDIDIYIGCYDNSINISWPLLYGGGNQKRSLRITDGSFPLGGEFGFYVATEWAAPFLAKFNKNIVISSYPSYAVPTDYYGYKVSAPVGKFYVPNGFNMFFRGIDPNGLRPMGTVENDELRHHEHIEQVGQGSGGQFTGWSIVGCSTILNCATSTQATGGEETRPVNLGFLPCIKYKDAASQILIPDAIKTGDVKFNPSGTFQPGWVVVSATATIGDATSGATERANADTETLFTFLWNTFDNTTCPVSTGRGVSAAADFAAHKTITLPQYIVSDPLLKAYIKL